MQSKATELTFTQAARREQMIQAAVDTVAEHGVNAATLARIAERIGIAKGGIIYHFSSKEELLNASLDSVFDRLSRFVIARVSAANNASDVVRLYIVGMIEYLDTHRNEVRLIAESYMFARTPAGVAEEATSRWQTLAGIIASVDAERGYGGPDPRVLAIVVSGGIDALVNEALVDPDFDLSRAAAQLAEMVGTLLTVPQPKNEP